MRYGTIIIVEDMLDPNGVNPKDRACVVITPDRFLVPGGPVDVVAISGTLPPMLDAFHVLLPWHAQGHPVTGQTKRCAAVCKWQGIIKPSRILDDDYGVVPGKQLLQITAALKILKP